MLRRSALKNLLLGTGVLPFLPLTTLKSKSEPLIASSLLDYYYRFTNSISTSNRAYNQFCSLYGCNLNQFSVFGYQPQFNTYSIQEKYYEFMWPTFRWTRELWSGANNVSMPIIDRQMNLNGHVGGPHLMGLGIIASHIRNKTSSSKLAADYTLPIDTFATGSHSFLANSSSDFETEKGRIEMDYDYFGFGRGSIQATITDWKTDESESIEIPVQFS